jgi:hypothetical protein
VAALDAKAKHANCHGTKNDTRKVRKSLEWLETQPNMPHPGGRTPFLPVLNHGVSRSI